MAGARAHVKAAVLVVMALCASCLFTQVSWADDGGAQGRPFSAAQISGQDASEGKSITSGALTVSRLEDFGGVSADVSSGDVFVGLEVSDDGDVYDVTCTVADTKVAKPAGLSWTWAYRYESGYVIDVVGAGKTTATFTYGEDSIEIPVVVTDRAIVLKDVARASYDEVELTWVPSSRTAGYYIERAAPVGFGESEKFEVVKTVQPSDKQGATATTRVKAPWNKTYVYRVLSYEVYGSKTIGDSEATDTGQEIEFTMEQPQVTIDSISKRTAKKMKLSWSCEEGAVGFEVYRSTSEGAGFKRLATLDGNSGKSYIDKKAKKGQTYYYTVSAVYPENRSVTSQTVGQMLAVKTKESHKVFSGITVPGGYGAYGWNWASSDSVFQYTQGNKMYVVCYQGVDYYNKKATLKIYGFNAKMKRVSTRTVKLPRHEIWGGLYHGPDGNNYVLLGYNNLKESKKKTVLKVVKYNAKWKKGKVASIKGSASNSFTGIYKPLRGGTASFDMLDDKLYLFTCREMFQSSDGLHHQSNIAFQIDTKTMKAKTSNVAYTSHSFNQRVKFKDGSIYLADHGDAYSRGICVTMENGYGTEDASSSGSVAFKFKGETGNNDTGATMGGMEVGTDNVLVCGTAMPHGYKVAGVKGFKPGYRRNVYVTVTNRKTGKSSVKWLTSINPKKGKRTIDECRMLKVSDDRFAVMFNIRDVNTNDIIAMRCVFIDGNGNVLKKKNYRNCSFSASSQPIVFNGSICWVEPAGHDYYDSRNDKAVVNRIPIL